MHLLEVARLAALAAGEAGRQHGQARPARQVAEEPLGRGAQPVGVDGAGGGEDHPVRAVVLGDEAREVGAAEAGDALGRAEDGAAERLAGVGGLLQPVEDDVVGRVERLADLLQDHPALDLDVGRVEQRVQHDVGEDVERPLDVGLEHAGVVGGHLLAGVGVDVAADVLDLLGDRLGASGSACP